MKLKKNKNIIEFLKILIEIKNRNTNIFLLILIILSIIKYNRNINLSCKNFFRRSVS